MADDKGSLVGRGNRLVARTRAFEKHVMTLGGDTATPLPDDVREFLRVVVETAEALRLRAALVETPDPDVN